MNVFLFNTSQNEASCCRNFKKHDIFAYVWGSSGHNFKKCLEFEILQQKKALSSNKKIKRKVNKESLIIQQKNKKKG